MSRPTLLQLYLVSQYEVRLPAVAARSVLRIAQPLPPALRHWLGADAGCAFITAYNPYSQLRDAASNRRAQRRLLQQLQDAGARCLPGAGRVPGQPWREPSLLVGGLDLPSLDRLAAEHGQNAVVTAGATGPVRLRLYGDGWGAEHAEFIDLAD